MLSRAKTLDNGKMIVEGYYFKPQRGEPRLQWHIDKSDTGGGAYIEHALIDPKTVEYKVGDNWYSMEKLVKITTEHKHELDRLFKIGLIQGSATNY